MRLVELSPCLDWQRHEVNGLAEGIWELFNRGLVKNDVSTGKKELMSIVVVLVL